MPTFRRIRRTIAALLLVLYLPACTHWVQPKGMTPQQYIAREQPKRVRVTLEDGTRQTILDPSTSHDSLLGYIPVRQSNNFVRSGPLWAASLASVRRLEVHRLNVATTVVGLTVFVGVMAGAAVCANVCDDFGGWD